MSPRGGPDPLPRGEHHPEPDTHHAESRSNPSATETRSSPPSSETRSSPRATESRSTPPATESRAAGPTGENPTTRSTSDSRPSPLAYSVTTAAAALGISEYSIYEMVRANRLPHVRIGRRILIPSKLLDAWLTAPGSWAPADTF